MHFDHLLLTCADKKDAEKRQRDEQKRRAEEERRKKKEAERDKARRKNTNKGNRHGGD